MEEDLIRPLQPSPCLPEANRVQNHEYVKSENSDSKNNVPLEEENKKGTRPPPLEKIHIEGISQRTYHYTEE